MLTSIETYRTCDFPGGGGGGLHPLSPPLWILACSKELNQCFQRKTMSLHPQIESASMFTALYCVIMIQAEIHQLFQGTNTIFVKLCGYLEYIWSRSSKSN